jgi:hypothetical protein
MRIINGGSVWAEVANMLFYPVLKNTATLLALFCIFYFGKVFLETEPVP